MLRIPHPGMSMRKSKSMEPLCNGCDESSQRYSNCSSPLPNRWYEFQENFDRLIRENVAESSLLHVNDHPLELSESDLFRLSFEKHLTSCGISNNPETHYYDLRSDAAEDGKFELTENEHDMNRVIYWLGQGTSKIRSDDADFGSDRISRTKSKAEKSIIREETGKLEKF
uniref:Ovule protein n=1 Tax=Ascaris lumbricoides TaxID=6252 RepID=A0A0M3HUX7_ASCLU